MIGKKLEFGKAIAGGITSGDVYVKDLDLIILFDGPVHFLQNPEQAAKNFDELIDLSAYEPPKTRLNNKIILSEHKHMIRFDYQIHNIMY